MLGLCWWPYRGTSWYDEGGSYSGHLSQNRFLFSTKDRNSATMGADICLKVFRRSYGVMLGLCWWPHRGTCWFDEGGSYSGHLSQNRFLFSTKANGYTTMGADIC